MSVAMAAFTIGQSGIDALFFDRVGAQALLVMSLLQGGAPFVAKLALTGTRSQPPISRARHVAGRSLAVSLSLAA
jgi:hypothetical protein